MLMLFNVEIKVLAPCIICGSTFKTGKKLISEVIIEKKPSMIGMIMNISPPFSV